MKKSCFEFTLQNGDRLYLRTTSWEKAQNHFHRITGEKPNKENLIQKEKPRYPIYSPTQKYIDSRNQKYFN